MQLRWATDGAERRCDCAGCTLHSERRAPTSSCRNAWLAMSVMLLLSLLLETVWLVLVWRLEAVGGKVRMQASM